MGMLPRLPSGTALACQVDERVMANSARSFDGTAKNFDGGTNTAFECGTKSWRIGVWINPASLTTDRWFISKATQTLGAFAVMTNSSGNVVIQYWKAGGGIKYVTISGFSTATWYHLWFGYDHSTGNTWYSLNGGAVVTSALGDASGMASGSGYNFRISGRSDGGREFHGEVAHAFYEDGTTPTSNEVAALWDGGIGLSYEEWTTAQKASLVSYWPGQEDSGVLEDVHGSNNLSDTGSVGSAEGVTNDKAWEFDDASNQHLASNNTGEMDDTEFSVVALFYPDDVGSYATVFCKGDESFTDKCWGLHQAFHRARFEVYETASTSSTSNVGDNTITAGVWNLLIGQHKDGQSPYVYCNDVSASDGASVTTINQSSRPVRVGRGFNTNYVDGAVQYCLYISRELTAAERAWLYNGGSFRSLSDIQQAANNSNSPGTGIWADVKHAYAGGHADDLIRTNAVDLTENGSPTTRTGATTSRLLTDVSGAGVNMTAENAPVYRWEDLSGNDYHRIQTTYASQPTYIADFEGSGQAGLKGGFFEDVNVPVYGSSNSWLVYANFSSDAANSYWWEGSGAGGQPTIISGYTGTSVEWFNNGSGSGDRETLVTTPGDTWHALSVVQVDGASCVGRADGVQSFSITPTQANSGVSLADVFGTGGAAIPPGAMARLVIYDSEVTSTDLTDAEEAMEQGFYVPATMNRGGLGGVLSGVE